MTRYSLCQLSPNIGSHILSPSVGNISAFAPWSRGCKGIHIYVDTSFNLCFIFCYIYCTRQLHKSFWMQAGGLLGQLKHQHYFTTAQKRAMLPCGSVRKVNILPHHLSWSVTYITATTPTGELHALIVYCVMYCTIIHRIYCFHYYGASVLSKCFTNSKAWKSKYLKLSLNKISSSMSTYSYNI